MAYQAKIVGALCVFVLSGILIAGLWPFQAPPNEVTWLKDDNGLHLGHHGTLISSDAFMGRNTQVRDSSSLEIWLEPALAKDSNTILAFFTPEHIIKFSLHQSVENLALQKYSRNAHIAASGVSLVFLHDVFRDRKPVFVTIASGPTGTRIYVDGTLASTANQFRLSSSDFNGRLVLGTSPVVNDDWSGLFHGLAIYNEDLTPAQVSRHFETWTGKGRPSLTPDEGLVALYLFDEHSGRTVHDRSGHGPNLYIPERYMILHEKFLEPPWREFHTHWGYWKNVLINIGGFVPLGFVCCAYFVMATRISRPALVTVVVGAAVSLTIEVLQAYLPTRDSGTTDLITNTLGTWLGVILYRWRGHLLTLALDRILSVVDFKRTADA